MISLKISPLRLVLIAVVLLIGLPSIAQITSNSPVCDSDNLQIQADLNGDEMVGVEDLLLLLQAFGVPCPD